jgi:predicted  nucleic acid-binding Zn-ribbon protein
MSKSDRKAAIQRHKAARDELERVSSKSEDVTPEIVEANSRVIEAEQSVPWWRR